MESADGTFNALDYAIEARDGGTAHLRYVHSGILADEWEDQYDAIGAHTDFYLHTLGQYLAHFNGRQVTYVGQPSAGIEGPEAAGTPDAMDGVRAALGVSSHAAVGDAVHASLGDAGTLDGVIDYSTPEFLGVRTAAGLYRFFGRNHYGSGVGMSAHLFVDGVDAAAHEAALKAWLDGVYAPQRVRERRDRRPLPKRRAASSSSSTRTPSGRAGVPPPTTIGLSIRWHSSTRPAASACPARSAPPIVRSRSVPAFSARTASGSNVRSRRVRAVETDSTVRE